MKRLETQIHTVTPIDTNQHGTIFGGKVMEWADMAASVLARRIARMPVVTAALDRMDFLNPIFVGEEAHITPTLVCTCRSSLQIKVEVKAVNPFTAKTRLTGKTLFTYVAMDRKTMKPSQIFAGKKSTRENQGTESKQKERGKKPGKLLFHGTRPGKKVRESWIENVHLIMPGDHDVLDLLFAGRYLSWVDIVGALSARRHCGSSVVTASIESVEFKTRVPKGSTISLTAKPIFSAKSSVQIQVTGWLWNPRYEPEVKIGEAFLTFVALDFRTGKTLTVPRLIVVNAKERRAYWEGQLRYLRRRS